MGVENKKYYYSRKINKKRRFLQKSRQINMDPHTNNDERSLMYQVEEEEEEDNNSTSETSTSPTEDCEDVETVKTATAASSGI